MNWKIVTLGEVLTESGILAEVSSSSRRITVRLNVKGVEKRPVGNDKEGATKYFVRKAGQFIYGRQNLHKGAFGIIPAELDGYESSQDLPAFDIAEQCEPAWLLYFLRQGNFYESLDRIARGIGSRRINPKDLYEIEMPLPPLDEQRALLQTLAATDEAAASLAQDFAHQATLLTRLSQAVLREAVQGRLVPQDTTDEPAAALLARIRAEKQRLVKEKKLRADKPLPALSETEVPYEVPEGWAWCRLDSIAPVGTGSTPLTSRPDYYGGNIAWITSGATGSDFIDSAEKTITETAVNETNCKVYPPGTLIVAMYGQGKTRGQVSELLIPAATNQACAAIQILLIDYITKDYIKLFFQKIYQEIRQLAEGGAQPNLNLDKIKSTIIPLPPLAEQRRIVAKVTELLAYCTELEVELQRARQAAEALHAAALREAFTGSEGAMAKAGS